MGERASAKRCVFAILLPSRVASICFQGKGHDQIFLGGVIQHVPWHRCCAHKVDHPRRIQTDEVPTQLSGGVLDTERPVCCTSTLRQVIQDSGSLLPGCSSSPRSEQSA